MPQTKVAKRIGALERLERNIADQEEMLNLDRKNLHGLYEREKARKKLKIPTPLIDAELKESQSRDIVRREAHLKLRKAEATYLRGLISPIHKGQAHG